MFQTSLVKHVPKTKVLQLCFKNNCNTHAVKAIKYDIYCAFGKLFTGRQSDSFFILRYKCRFNIP